LFVLPSGGYGGFAAAVAGFGPGLKPPAHPERQRQGQRQRKKQIPFGNDRKKDKNNSKDKGLGLGWVENGWCEVRAMGVRGKALFLDRDGVINEEVGFG
jgi:hypothetical protein